MIRLSILTKGKLKLLDNQSYETIARVLAKNLAGEIFHCFCPEFRENPKHVLISAFVTLKMKNSKQPELSH